MFVRKGAIGEYSYFLGNQRCFFHRFADSGFKSKWCGLWSSGKKSLEYFAVKVDGEWLSPGNHKSFEYDFSKAVHTYETERGKVRETIFIPEESNCALVMIEAWPRARIEVKVAVNIRMRNENITSRHYSVSGGTGDSLEVENGLGKAFITAGDGGVFDAIGAYEEHSPSGENQNYFVPAKISFSREKAVFSVGTEASDARNAEALLRLKESCYSRMTRGMMSSDNAVLSKAFESCALSMELLKKDGGYYAGLPWFQQFWGRDSLWSLPAMLSLGRHDDARNVLRFFTERSDGGRIPNFISETGENATNSIDATPLWVISLERYVKCSGDVAFLREMSGHLEAAMDFLSSRCSGGLIMHDKERPETWMDTLRRPDCAVEIQSLYYGALKSASYLFSLIGKDTTPLKTRLEWLERSFAESFRVKGSYADRIEGARPVMDKTANLMIPLFMGPGKGLPGVAALSEDKNELLSGRGIRTLSKDSDAYSPCGYHTGSSWSLTTAWAAAAQFSMGREKQGWSLMEMLASDIEKDALGCIGECWDSETLALSGCSLQLWGVALFVTLLDDFMLGIEADATEKTISVCPRIPPSIGRVERRVLVGKEYVMLSFEVLPAGARVTCSSPAVKLIKKPAQINYVD